MTDDEHDVAASDDTDLPDGAPSGVVIGILIAALVALGVFFWWHHAAAVR